MNFAPIHIYQQDVIAFGSTSGGANFAPLAFRHLIGLHCG